MMKQLFTAFVFIICFGNCVSAQTPYCDSSLWTHVYHSYRLIVDSPCMTVTGHIYSTPYSEPDGDYHIRLKLDTQFNYMLDSLNLTAEHGCLVCEPICVVTPTQTDAIVPCQGYTSSVFLPNAGEYVEVTGPYVHDNDHGWNEIHPVTSIRIIYPTGVSAPPELPALKVYPVPATDAVNFAFDAPPHTNTYISIFAIDGREVGDYMLGETSAFILNTTYWPNGTYLYTITQDKGVLKSGKFVVVK